MEEIIIDGVNVAGCKYFRMNNKMPMCRACNSGMGSPYCEYEKNCYYKQLKRLEKENKMLQELKDEDSLRVVQLAKENAELKEELESYNCNANCYKYKEANKYKQALEEVKQICDWRNEYNSIGIDDYKKIIKDVESKVNEVL